MNNETASVPSPRMPRTGDILVSSWGYDQTNIDFYVVTKVTKASVMIRKCAKVTMSAGSEGSDDRVIPNSVNSATGPVLTRRFRLDTSTISDKSAPRGYKTVATYRVSISDYAGARLWEGTPEYQTPANCGH